MVRLAAGLLVLVLVAAPAAAVEPADVTVTAGRSAVRMETGAVVATLRLGRVRLKVRERGGRVLTASARDGGLFYERAGEHVLGRATNVTALSDGAHLTVETDEGSPATLTVRFLTRRTLEVVLEPPAPGGVEALGARFRSPRSERIYGLTERLRDAPVVAPGLIDVPVDDVTPVEVGSLDRRGEQVEMRVLPTFSIYAPFYQSSRGYGLHVAGTTFGRFDVAATDPRTVAFRFETGSTAESRRLVFAVFAGPEHATVLDEYTALTGRPFVPPDWAFLHWRWRDQLASGPTALLDGTPVNAEVADDVLMYDALGIPAGVYLFDRPALVGNYGFARWEWDETRLPNPGAMLDALRSRGYHLAIWSGLWTCGSNPGDNGLEAQALGYLVPGSSGTPNCADVGGRSFIMDPTNPAAAAWWRDRVAAFMATWGIQAIKLDRGEEHIPSEADDVWADGRTGREVRNDYPRLQARIHHDALASAFPGDFLVLARPSYTGTSPWAIFWGGDITAADNFGSGASTDLGLRSAIISQQRAAFLGVPIWGSDTGGYYQFKDREVFARWLEFSTFSGVMEIGGHGTHAPWDMPTVPAYDPEMIDIYRRYTTLRHTLQPYIVAAAAEAATGTPLVRPMPFYDRKDAKLGDLWDQYLFGPDLLVAPVWRVGERTRSVYLPKGRWRSYWSPGEVLEGKRTVSVSVPLDTIPVYVRDGATVPGP